MAKILVTFLSRTKVMAECSDEDALFFREKMRVELENDEKDGTPEADLEGICAIKRWLFSGTPCQVQLDTENEQCRIQTVPPGIVANNKWLEWIEAFQILAKYSVDGYVNAEHDAVMAGVTNQNLISIADLKRLEDLGWHAHEDGGLVKSV